FRVKDVSESCICSLSWHPHQETALLVANKNGCIGIIRLPEIQDDGVLSPRSMNALLGCDEDGDTDELLRAAAAQAESSRLMDEDDLVRKDAGADKTNIDDEDDDDVHSIDLSRIKSGFMELEDDIDAEMNKQTATSVPTANVIKGDAVPMQPLTPAILEAYPSNRIQRAFQPGSMPFGFRERFMVWNRYGLVIQYRSAETDPKTEEPDNVDRSLVDSIEVEFHDTTVHHSLRLSNTIGYTMADLSLTALLLATPGTHDPTLADDADAGEPIDQSDISQVAVLPLDTSKVGGGDSSSEWTIKLPPGEACEAVCLVPNNRFQPDHTETGYAVVATSRRFLRIFAQPTPSAALVRPSANLHLFQITRVGLPPVSLPYCGVVAMTSHPSEPILGMVVSSATGELMWRLFYLGGMMLGSCRSRQPSWLSESLVTWQPLPVSLSPPRSSDRASSAALPVKLTWFGFSDFGGLYTHDASGVVRRLTHGRLGVHRDYNWVPVCDTRTVLKPSNRRSDNYFIVGVLESSEAPISSLVTDHLTSRSDKEAGLGQLQAIYCKASKWPRVFPRPVVCSLPFCLPLCAMDTDQGSLEDNYLRHLISEDWPVWGPNPRAPLCTVDAAKVDLSDLFQAVSSKCVTKRKGVLLRLFALAAKLESDWASLAIARLMPDAATVQLAIRYAGRLRRQHLAHRLAGIALDKERGADVDNQDSLSSDKGESEIDGDDRDELPPQRITPSRVRTNNGLSRGTDPRSHRYPSGSHEEDLTNVSLVSSATDDTHDEGHISGLPLPESEPITQSFLSNTPSTTRNPFRDSAPDKIISNRASRKKPALHARGSEVLDSWQPNEPSVTTTNACADTAASKMMKKSTQASKKRTAPTPAEKRRSKLAKSSEVVHTEYVKLTHCVFTVADGVSDERENKMKSVPPGRSFKMLSEKEGTSHFANKASRRLSSFRFESNDHHDG
ncbi:WD repeat and HMG-box DNA-binding protein 1, partial [Fasciola hepatica]